MVEVIDVRHRLEGDQTMELEESALELMLRSPRFDVGQIMELLDIGDREFREIAQRNERIARLLEERREGTLKPPKSEPRRCRSCKEWFMPYASDRYCSDNCKEVARLTRR